MFLSRKLLFEFEMHSSWEAFIKFGNRVTLKKQISDKWTQVVALFNQVLWICNRIVYSQYAPKFVFANDGSRHNL